MTMIRPSQHKNQETASRPSPSPDSLSSPSRFFALSNRTFEYPTELRQSYELLNQKRKNSRTEDKGRRERTRRESRSEK